jgi:hypothetical protein
MENTHRKQREKQEQPQRTSKALGALQAGRPRLAKEQTRTDWSGSFSTTFLVRVRAYAKQELRSVSSAIEILATRQLEQCEPQRTDENKANP